MNKEPQITEEKLKILIECLVSKFRAEFGDNKSKLSEKQFLLLERMGCCKAAGLNFEYKTTTDEDQIVIAHSSAYVAAVNKIADLGWVELTGNKLTFCLTNTGYEKGLQKNEAGLSLWDRFKVWANENQGVIAVYALIIAVCGLIIGLESGQ